MGATWLDSAVVSAVAPELRDVAAAQDENDRMLKARWERILARTDLTPQQRLQAEREYARLGGVIDNWTQIATGASETFAEEYVETVKKTTVAATSFVANKLIPWQVWALIALGVVVFALMKGKK